MKKLTYLLPALCILLIVWFSSSEVFRTQEMFFYDLLMKTRPAQAADPEIVIIEISDDTLKNLGQWPLSRDFHAALLKVLHESGASLVAFDLLLSEPSESDGILAEAMRISASTVLPYAFKLEKEKDSFRPVEVLGGISQGLRPAVARTGHINVIVDPDGKVRRLPLLLRYQGEVFPSLGLAVAAARLGIMPQEMRFDPGRLSLGTRHVIPLDPTGEFWVNYPGAWSKTFRHYSYFDILKSYTDRQKGIQPQIDLGALKGAVCFVGLTATGTSELRANPFDTAYPMVGVQASACDSILRRAFLRRLSLFPRSLINTGIFLLSIKICLGLAPLAAFFSSCALGLLCAGFAWLVFSLSGVFGDLFLPLATIAFVYVAILLRKFFAEEQKRRILEKELEIAASIQRSFLPADANRLGSIGICSYLEPARFVGGDLYDIISLDEAVFGVFIGDVSGKGVSASLVMAQTISLLRVLARDSRDPAEVLSSLNDQLSAILKDRFVTGQYLVVDTKANTWQGACAGHMPLFCYHKVTDTLTEALAASGPPLGLSGSASYKTYSAVFQPGDKILMYTDGWTEARNRKNQEFGVQRLKEAFWAGRSKAPEGILSELRRRHEGFSEKGRLFDDLTLVILGF
ncbi:MAG: CHASE2 domain-containing protein [Candidatus Omnitrophica bacterium]|nr:CHASE2 domain-containing protein [Candidatus Omnitrophota bacterium]